MKPNNIDEPVEVLLQVALKLEALGYLFTYQSEPELTPDNLENVRQGFGILFREMHTAVWRTRESLQNASILKGQNSDAH